MVQHWRSDASIVEDMALSPLVFWIYSWLTTRRYNVLIYNTYMRTSV